MPVSANFIRILERVQPELREVFLALWEEIERQRTVTKDEFNELKEIVRDISESLRGLAEAQRRTEERLNEFERRTEENFAKVWEAIERLTEAQRKTEERLNQLAEAQRKTEERLNELTERMNQLTIRVDQLAEAQRKTEKEIEKLTKGLESLRREVGGLAHTVGYRLEDEAMKALPELLKRDVGVEVIGRLKRDYIEVSPGKYIEVNIWGTGRMDGEEYLIVGEARSQLKKGDVDEFIKKVNVIKKYIPKEQIKILVTYQTSPPVKKYAEEKGIKVYFSYEF